jgi:hypothetical protein
MTARGYRATWYQSSTVYGVGAPGGRQVDGGQGLQPRHRSFGGNLPQQAIARHAVQGRGHPGRRRIRVHGRDRASLPGQGRSPLRAAAQMSADERRGRTLQRRFSLRVSIRSTICPATSTISTPSSTASSTSTTTTDRTAPLAASSRPSAFPNSRPRTPLSLKGADPGHRLYKTCHPAILGHRGRRLATAQLGVSKPGRSTDGVSYDIRERSSSMKNRKREICTFGTVRDEGGNIFIYSAARRRGPTGYVEGLSVAVEYRHAENQVDRLPALAANLVRRRVAVDRGRRSRPSAGGESSDHDHADRLPHRH